MLATREYVDKHGKPVAFYSDKHAVFRVSQAETRRTGMTQFGLLAYIDQGRIVDNKRLGAVLKLAQEKQDELETAGKRNRSQHMPKKRAQVQEQLRAMNPVLADPTLFKPSLKR